MEIGTSGLAAMFGDSQSLMVFVLVFAVVFIVVAAAGLHFANGPKILDGTPPRDSRWRASAAGPQARPKEAAPAGRPPNAMAEFRKTLHKGFRVLAVIAVGTLAVLTVHSYFATDPNDGSRLLTIVLAAGTMLLAMHLHELDRRHRPSEGGGGLDPRILRDLRTDVAGRIGAAAMGRAKVQWTIGSPEVHSIDQQTLDRARALAGEGRPIDEICRTITPEYGEWDPFRQQAHQALVWAAIEHKG